MTCSLRADYRAVFALVALLALPLAVQAQGTVYRVPLTGVVELGLAPFIERSLDEALAAGAHFVVIDMDTPGGRVDAAERIADAIGDAGLPV
ncbi:MAG: nodulation protein NfeD, partial [Gemmatimonadota bacterium]|nr:nodulation protein NfeD [Gemmatimonadota bacterium]